MSESEVRAIARHRRITIVALVLVAAGNLAGIVVPAGTGWDFANFYDTGSRVAAGEVDNLYSPTAPIAGRQPQGELGFYGTPLSAYLYAPMSWLSPGWALVAFKVENALVLGLSLGLLYGFHRRLVAPSAVAQWRFSATFAVACLLYQPLWTIYRVGGQTTPTILLLVTLALIFHSAGRSGRAAASFAVAVAIKPALATGLAFLAACSGIGFLGAAALAGALLGGASVLLTGWPIHAVFLERMLAHANLVWPWYYNSSLFIVLDNARRAITGETAIGGAEGLFGWAVVVLKLGVVALSVRVMLAARGCRWTPAAARHFRVVMALAFFLLVSQTVWEHYLALLFPMLVYCLAMRPVLEAGVNRLVTVIILLSIGQNLVIVNFIRGLLPFDSVAGLLFIALLKSGPLLCLVLLLVRYRRQLFDSYADAAWQSLVPAAPGCAGSRVDGGSGLNRIREWMGTT